MAADEQVLVVPAESLNRLGGLIGLSSEVTRYQPLLSLAANPEFRRRGDVETDPSWLQLIPYIVLRHQDRVFVYTRGQAGGEKRLHALRSVGIGGHINPCDAEADNPYRAGMLRELEEEVTLTSSYTESLLGFVHDPSTPVGQVHLGVVHVLTLENADVKPRDPAIAAGGFEEISKLRSELDSFETWSKFALNSIASSSDA